MSLTQQFGAITRHWQPDEETNFCTQCNDAFSFLKRRHHCRACGKIFCAECSNHRLLIPQDRTCAPSPNSIDDYSVPQRCCSACARNLQSVQADLRLLLSKANAENVFERESPERYLNMPLSFSLEMEIRKAAYTLYNFTADNAIEGKDKIPKELLLGAKGIAFLTIGKIGFLLTGRLGSGLVIARLSDGSWSAPSAIAVSGLGWGFQVGGELTDVMLVLTTSGAVDAFCSNAQIAVGTELAVSLGPVGRSAGTDLTAGDHGSSAAFSYAHSKGLFVGASMEASIIACRSDINCAFYGMDVKPSQLLSGAFPRPKAAEPLYKALSEVLSDVETDRYRRTTDDRQFTSVSSVFDGPQRNATASKSESNVIYYNDLPKQSTANVLQHGYNGNNSNSNSNGDIQRSNMQTKQAQVEERELNTITKSNSNNQLSSVKGGSLSSANIWSGIGEGNFGSGELQDDDEALIGNQYEDITI